MGEQETKFLKMSSDDLAWNFWDEAGFLTLFS